MAEYNGWSNYETWCFHNYLINSVPYEEYEDFDDKYKLSVHLKDEAEELFYGMMEQAGFAIWMHDICGSAFERIDFYEIAEAIYEYNENEKEKEALDAS